MENRLRRRVGALALAVGCLLLAACGDGGESPSAADLPACPEPSETLPGMRTGAAPWPPELDNLGERLDRIGLPRLTQEGQALDFHVQLSVEVEGTDVRVPTSVGLNGEEVAGGRMVSGFVAAIHTHDDTGLVHVHSPDVRPYTLGQLFDVWGVSFTEERIGGYCADDGHALTVEANGEAVAGDPRRLELEDRQRVEISYGDE
jgi:hypothetical protein